MKFTHFILISSIFACTVCWGMQEEKESEVKAPAYRGLLVFLDDSESKQGAITIGVLAALQQKAVPFLASYSLFRNIRADKIIANNWVCKAALGTNDNKELLLFIPTEYLKKNAISELDVRVESTQSITNTELTLGLIVNHMKNIHHEKIINIKDTYYNNHNSQTSSPKNFALSLKKIFCPRTEYQKKNIPTPTWSIYLDGHGSSEDIKNKDEIAGMPIDLFRDHVLSFFKNSINVRLLLYSSCYSAGMNAEKIYSDQKKHISETYPFAIITTALTDAATRVFDLDFTQFLKEATQDTINYEKITNCITPIIQTKDQHITWATTPQIKLPGLEWFSVLASNKDIVSIGQILASTRKKQQLNIEKYFKTDQRAILLYAKDVPCELIINSPNMEAFISMVPGDAVHRIKKISSTKWTVDEILDWFIVVRRLSSCKKIFIESISDSNETINDVLIYMERVQKIDEHYEAVITTFLRKAFFKTNGINYQKDASWLPQSGGELRGPSKFPERIALGSKEPEEYKKIIAHQLSGSKLPLSITPESITELEKVTSPASRMRHSPDFLRNLQEKQVQAARATWQRMTAERK